MERTGLAKSELCRILGISRMALYRFLNGEEIFLSSWEKIEDLIKR
ncbi:MAG: hypothetical protein ACYSW3_00035 [Planctomycetota bacterium]